MFFQFSFYNLLKYKLVSVNIEINYNTNKY